MPALGRIATTAARAYGMFGRPSVPSDPNWSSVSLLLPGNGTNGAQNNTFLDSSTNNFTITRNGNTTQGTFSPFPPAAGTAYSAATNGGSGYFDGAGDNITAPDNAAFTMGNGNFTIECWMYPLLSTRQIICWQGDNTGLNSTASFSIEITASTKMQGYVFSSGTAYIATSTASISINTWTHVAFVRNGNTTTVYLNGTADGTVNVTGVTINDSSEPVKIGDYTTAGGGLPFSGYLSGFRIVKGTAVYTANFTPPTAPLTAIANTSLLLNFTNGGIYDAAAKNDLETVGNAQISTTQSKWGGSSMYFDGTGDYLLMPSNTLLAFGTGDYTIEFWARHASVSGQQTYVGDTPGNTNGAYVYKDTSNKVGLYYTTQILTGTTTIAVDTWYFIAVSRSSGTVRLFVNGTQEASAADSTNLSVPVQYVGGDTLSGNLNGYIQDLRITKGVARYTSNFTPPTAAFPVQ